MADGHVVVIGDLVTDVMVRLAEPPAPGSDAEAEVRFGGGGSAANVACWLATTGVEVVLVGRIGADAAGEARRSELRDAGVACRLAVDVARPTGAIVVLVDDTGERTMLTDRGANRALATTDLPVDLIERAAWLHLSGYPLLEETSRPAALDALARARAAGVRTSVDPSSRNPLAAVGPERFRGWTEGVDVLLPNLAEAQLLAGHDEPETAVRALATAYDEVVVTLGAQGCLWSDGRETLALPAGDARVVDTTGAGDAFAAGYIAASVMSGDPKTRCRRGVELAAQAVARVGGRP